MAPHAACNDTRRTVTAGVRCSVLLVLLLCTAVGASSAPEISSPIRVRIDTALVDAPQFDNVSQGQRTCTSIGQRWCDTAGSCTGSCRSTDLVNATSRTKILLALQHASSKAESMLLVNRAASADLTPSRTLNCATGHPAAAYGTDVQAADHIVFVTMRPSADAFPSISIICSYASLDGRPLTSTVNVPPEIVFTSTDTQLESVATRSLLQVLGFDYDAVPRFLAQYPNTTYQEHDAVRYRNGPIDFTDATGLSALATQPLGAGIVVGSNNGPALASATTRLRVITPSVVAAAREHFACPSAGGVLLEESYSTFMRWERRVLNMELLSSEFLVPPTPLLTRFTVAMFRDMGFYAIQTTFTPDTYTWGTSMGCSFLTDCTPSSWGLAFCNDTYAVRYDGTAFGPCVLVDDAADLSLPYRHFPEKPKQGGVDTFADYCPYLSDATEGTTSCTASSDTTGDVGLTFSNRTCTECRALRSAVIGLDYGLPSSEPDANAPQCMEVLCLNATALAVRVGDTFFTCPSVSPSVVQLAFPPSADPSVVRPPLYPHLAVWDYSYYGALQCPRATDMCSTQTSSLYRAQRDGAALSSASWPVLLDVQPRTGSITGGDTLTVTGVNLRRRNTTSIDISCRGLLVGGHPTDPNSYVFVGTVAGVDTFTVNTTALPGVNVDDSAGGSSSVDTLLGGSNADGSGTVDVVVLCRVSGVLECRYDGYCGIGSASLRRGFTLLPRPAPPRGRYFLSDTNVQLGVGAAFVAVMIGCSVAMYLYCRSTYAPPSTAESRKLDGEPEAPAQVVEMTSVNPESTPTQLTLSDLGVMARMAHRDAFRDEDLL